MNTDLDRLLPDDLCDEAAAHVLELLYEIVRLLEARYAGQLLRYYDQPNPAQIDLWD